MASESSQLSSRAYLRLLEAIVPCGIIQTLISPIGLTLTPEERARKLSSLFHASALAADLRFFLRIPCRTGSNIAPRPRRPDMGLTFSSLSFAGSCAACKRSRNNASRSFLSGRASATRTCLALETSRLGRYSSGLACF